MEPIPWIDAKYCLDGIAYNEKDTPPFLYKAMELRYAKLLIEFGKVRIHKLPFYKKLEDSERGDQFEGEYHETIKRDGKLIPITAKTTPLAFLFCTSLPTMEPPEMLHLFKGAECVVKIKSVHELCLRIQTAVALRDYRFGIICGKAIYDHGKIVDRPTHDYYSTYFQKHPKYANQKEYRIVLVDDYWYVHGPHNYYGRKIECDCPLIEKAEKYTKCPKQSSLCCECVDENKVMPPFNDEKCPIVRVSQKCKECPLKDEGYVDIALGECSDIIELLEI